MTNKQASEHADQLGLKDLQRRVQDVAARVTATADKKQAENQDKGQEEDKKEDKERKEKNEL